MTTTIKRPKRDGKKCYVLVFDGKRGKFKKNEQGNYVLDPIEKNECVSIVDARAVMLKYLSPALIPSYEKCRNIIKTDGYLFILKLKDRNFLG